MSRKEQKTGKGKQSEKRFPLLLAFSIIALLVGLVEFYLDNVQVYYPLEGKVYRTVRVQKDVENEDIKFFNYLIFKDGKMYYLITDEYHTSACYRLSYDYTSHVWNHIGPVYFRRNSILSATTEKFNGTPISLYTECTQSRGFNSILSAENEDGTYSLLDKPYFYTYDSKNDVGTKGKFLIVANDECLTFGDAEYKKVDENNDQYKGITELAKIYLDDDGVFSDYYDASFSN